MKLLFLRGQVPQDRDPKQIMFNDLNECDDMWTQLAYELCKDSSGEIWYWNGNRTTNYKPNFIERWIPSFDKTPNFNPDVIFARGGFPQYDNILKKYPKAIKIYYGAGQRFYPRGFKKYHIIFNDTPEQVNKTKSLFPNTKVYLLTKPAADNIFKPLNVPKKYDVIMVANELKRDIKGNEFAYINVPRDLKFIKVGIKRKDNKYNHICFTGWVPRKKIPKLYSQSKVSIVCCNKIDSSPRVIPESLACGCPILCLSDINFWKQQYINEQTGMICDEKNFKQKLKLMVDNYNQFDAYNYYSENLSLGKSASKIIKIITDLR